MVVVEVRYQPNWERGAFGVFCIEGWGWACVLSFCPRCLGGERNWGVFGRFWAFWGGDGGGVGVRYQIGGQYGANRVYLGRADEAYSLLMVLDRAKNRGFFGVLVRSGAGMVAE